MIDPISYIARKIRLHKYASTAPTRLLPLSEVHKATVFVDTTDSDSDQAAYVVKKFFGARGISVNVICPQKWDVSIFGWLKQLDNTNPDMFVCLAHYENFAAEYAARCSNATFKVGRRQLPGDVFDLVLSNPEDQLPLQHKAFLQLMDLLTKIQ